MEGAIEVTEGPGEGLPTVELKHYCTESRIKIRPKRGLWLEVFWQMGVGPGDRVEGSWRDFYIAGEDLDALEVMIKEVKLGLR